MASYIRNFSESLNVLLNKASSRTQKLHLQASRQEIEHIPSDISLEIQDLLADDTLDSDIKDYVLELLEAKGRGDVVTLTQDADGTARFQIHERDSPLSSATNSRISFPSQIQFPEQYSGSSPQLTPAWYPLEISFPSTRGLGIRILSCDGGGVRGLSELVILLELQKTMKNLGLANIAPCRIFDMIIGTSTGGIIALLLGRCGYTIEQCIEVYKRFSRDIFDSNAPFKIARFAYTNCRLNSDIINAKMEEVIGKCFGDVKTPLASGMQHDCKVAVVASKFDSMDSGEPVVLRSYASTAGPACTATIVQAARATSAAPSYFSPQTIDGVRYIDGGIGNNNPSLIALAEADALWPDREIDAFVSIGTGTGENISAKDRNKASVSMTTGSHIPHERIVRNDLLHPDQYFRFTVPGLGSAVHLDKWEKLDEITERTKAYLKTPEVEAETLRCAKALGL